jgi:hypothetical protein
MLLLRNIKRMDSQMLPIYIFNGKDRQKDAKPWSRNLIHLEFFLLQDIPYVRFLRSALQTVAACLRLALACNMAAFPDTEHAILLRIQQTKIWITLTWKKKNSIATHKYVPTYNGQYHCVSKYGPIPFSIRDSFFYHREEGYGFLEIYVRRGKPSNKLYITLSLLQRS